MRCSPIEPTEIMARSATASTGAPAPGSGLTEVVGVSAGPCGIFSRPPASPPSELLPSSVVVLMRGMSVYAYSGDSSFGATVGAGADGAASGSVLGMSVGVGCGNADSVVKSVINSVTVLRSGYLECQLSPSSRLSN